jgi:hypothetical protein
MNAWYREMLKRVKHQRPFDDLLATVQLAIRNPKVHTCKIFAKYSQSGNDGKGYIDSCLSCIFGEHKMLNLKVADIESPFNSYMMELFNVLDEAQSENYTTKRLDENLKNSSNPEIVITCKGKGQVNAANHTIMGVNSNDKTIYGITRGDAALLSRMVFIELTPIGADYERFYAWSQNEYNPSTTDFKRSMYQWLRDEFEPPADYTPNRYIDHPEKDDYIKSANMTRKNSVESWMVDAADQFENTELAALHTTKQRLAHYTKHTNYRNHTHYSTSIISQNSF